MAAGADGENKKVWERIIMANDDGSRRVSVSADAVRARAAALGLSLALDDSAAMALALRVQDAAADAERMGELEPNKYEPAVEFRPLAARKE